ncbi:MAG: hypothetical protein M9899_05735, partial [Bdellovibrionaceae bacterium]|nr:hypothetical protein [Pseudobdellovibrionaceae bacterium]
PPPPRAPMKIWAMSLITLFYGIGVQAQVSSEYLLQAEKGQSFVEFTLNDNASKYRDKVMAGPIPISLRNYSVNYEWGMLEKISIYGNLLYSTSTIEADHSGLGPVQLGAKFSQDIGSGLFFGKLNVAANVIEGKLDCNASGKCNVSDSSFSADIQLAYQWSLTNAFTGFAVNYGLFSTDGKNAGGSFDKAGYLTVSAFYERALNDNLWGLVLTYIDKGGLLGLSPAYPYSGNNVHIDREVMDAYAVSAYLKTVLSEKTHFITEVEYSRVLNERDSFASSKSQNMAFNLTVRRMF